jgi:hypothetical protein
VVFEDGQTQSLRLRGKTQHLLAEVAAEDGALLQLEAGDGHPRSGDGGSVGGEQTNVAPVRDHRDAQLVGHCGVAADGLQAVLHCVQNAVVSGCCRTWGGISNLKFSRGCIGSSSAASPTVTKAFPSDLHLSSTAIADEASKKPARLRAGINPVKSLTSGTLMAMRLLVASKRPPVKHTWV